MTIEMWSRLGQEEFNTHQDSAGEIDPVAADNILIAHPCILRFLEKEAPQGNLLEFGCGAGYFAQELSTKGYKVTAIDPAEGMISQAQKNTSADINFIVGNSRDIPKGEDYDGISSVMVFQFIEDPQAVIKDLKQRLKPTGSIILAVFNPAWVECCVKQKYRFRGFDNPKCVGQGIIDYGGDNNAPVYIRTAEEYDNIFKRLGFEKKYEETPPFTDAFKQAYPEYIVDVPEFLILGYSQK